MEEKIELIKLKCRRCEHGWWPKPETDKPKACPKCKNTNWDKPKKIPAYMMTGS